ncbi:MAG: OmpA family protein [Crocinitomicaceae bacterium]
MKTRIALAVICLTGKSMLFAQSTQEVILFDYDSYALNENASDQLDQFIQNLDVENIKKVEIIGHTDSDGSLEYNRNLSLNRAKTIEYQLNINGIAQKQIEVHYKGEENPIASNSFDDGKQTNRRVEIHVEYKNKFEIPEAFLVQPYIYKINPEEDTVIDIGAKGSTMYIPKYAFVDDNGKVVRETVEIAIKEYRSSADIAFSGIPMTIQQNGEEQFFSSAGMLDIRGFSEENPVQIAKNKSLRIDYSMVNADEGNEFFKINDQGHWDQKRSIQTLKFITRTNKVFHPELNSKKMEKKKNEKMKHFIRRYTLLIARAKYKELQWNASNLREIKEIEQLPESKKKVRLLEQKCAQIDRQYNRKVKSGQYVSYREEIKYEHEDIPVPNLVEGLDIGSFGVYNCDKINRVPNKIDVLAKYEDEKGNPIIDIAFLTLVDPNYNGAFYFSPEKFTCNATANNTIALFTQDGQLYLSKNGAFPQMNLKNNETATFKMVDMTDKIQSKEELAKHLGIRMTSKT